MHQTEVALQVYFLRGEVVVHCLLESRLVRIGFIAGHVDKNLAQLLRKALLERIAATHLRKMVNDVHMVAFDDFDLDHNFVQDFAESVDVLFVLDAFIAL